MTATPSRALQVALLFIAAPAFAQSVGLLPPSGDNQRAMVTQAIGPVTVSVEYSSPRVTLKGEDRRGKIWGQLVPFGLSDLGFNGCTSCPWRGGANENTVFTTSHDLTVQGQRLPAGKYGLHFIPGKEAWTVLFSRNSSSWGSFSYDPKEDALRVQARPVKAPFREWLTYEFTEREPARATLALAWEELALPLSLAVENAEALWVARMASELRGAAAFDWHNFRMAAEYCLQHQVELAQGLRWAQRAIDPAIGGDENFTTLMTLSRLQAANGQASEAAKTLDRATAHPAAKPLDLHFAARALLADGKKAEALRLFQLNATRFPDQWPVHAGLMRGYAATGEVKKALQEAKLAREQAPDEANRKNLDRMVALLEAGKSLE
jgi:tetratricopeptide (TPR) repeat protein